MTSKLETAAKIYLVASRMNVELTMATMRRVYGRNSKKEHLEAVTKAVKRMPDIATAPDRLKDSALIQLIRHNGSEDAVRINMSRQHPCNTMLQIEQAVISASSDPSKYDSDGCLIFQMDEFYFDRAFGRNTSGPYIPGLANSVEDELDAVPAWSAAFARVCDVPEEIYSPGYDYKDQHSVDMQNDEKKEYFVESVKTHLICHIGDDDNIRKVLRDAYDTSDRNIDWAVTEARRRLSSEMDSIEAAEMERFAWIQMVCGLFGRKDIRDWVLREYPYADAAKMDLAFTNASKRLSDDIEMAGPEVAIPGAMYQYVAAGEDDRVAANNAKKQWDYLNEHTVGMIFLELVKPR